MRSFLHLLALLALMVAPLAAPAAATAKPTTAECAEMAMESSGHDMPSSDHGKGKACCIAVPPAIDPPIAPLVASPAIEHLAFVDTIASFRLGAGPKAEDPPPRMA